MARSRKGFLTDERYLQHRITFIILAILLDRIGVIVMRAFLRMEGLLKGIRLDGGLGLRTASPKADFSV